MDRRGDSRMTRDKVLHPGGNLTRMRGSSRRGSRKDSGKKEREKS